MGVLKKPLITEKMTARSEKLNEFGFVVEREATKEQIKKEIETLYNVKVDRINTMIYAGKNVSRYTKRGLAQGRTPAFKKAIVTLKDGATIDFFENV